MKKLLIYNLGFPEYINSLKIGDYTFNRVEKYEQAFLKLQHLVDVSGGEFHRKLTTGIHQITATVELPKKEKSAVLPWAVDNFTQLNDILFLLSIFTGRNVFEIPLEQMGLPIIADPRQHRYGGQLNVSVSDEWKWKNKLTGDIINERDFGTRTVFEYVKIHTGFEKSLNEVLNLICSSKWQREYNKGYFLFSYRRAIRQEDVDAAFLHSWTIWEHLFTLHNRKWLDDKSIEQMPGDKKIAYILNKYLLITINNATRKAIKKMAKARNKIIHYGTIPDNIDLKELNTMVGLTEQIIAIILGLKPSNIFNSMESLERLIEREQKKRSGKK